MKKISSLLLGLFFSFVALAQVPGDTITVSSLIHTSTTRDTMVSFPDLPANVTFEKIIMQYNMRCKGAQVSTAAQRNLGCGEWDYSCNTFITDSTKADSLMANTKSHRISNFTGTSFDWKPTPNYYRHRQLQPNTSTTVFSQTFHPVGNGAINVGHAIPTHDYNGRSQYLFTAAELSSAGLSAGSIDAIMMTANNSVATQMLRVKMKHSSLTQLNASTPVDTGFQEVFNHNKTLYAFSAGDSIRFHTPFMWDGTSNVLVEFSFNWPNGLSTFPTVKGHTTTGTMGISSSADKHLLLNGSNHINVPSYAGISGSNDRTVEAWINTKVANKEIVTWGDNSTSAKWIVRVNGGGQLRLEVNGGYMIGTTLLNDSAWHHIAVSFSGTNVNQAVLYVDGQVETISSSQAAAVNTNTTTNDVRIGHGTNNTYFDGRIDNVRIWSAALSQTQIQNWMRKKLDNTHPSFSNLELDLSADASTGLVIADASGNNRDGNITANPYWTTIEGKNIFKDFVAYNERPDIQFVNGTYSLTNTIDTFWYNIEQPPHFMDSAIITSNAGTIMNDAITYSAATSIWDANTAFIQFDEIGNFLNVVPGSSYGTINIVDLPYYQRSPMAFEIMSFVTPYGIGLDLGPNGKTWTFDLTDFSTLLKGDKRMFLTFGGQWQEEMDIKFMYIVGTPPRDVLDINNIWKSQRSSTYTNINNDVVFPPRDITLPSTASSFKIRSSITGHGQQGEFVPRTHHLNLDGGNREYSWQAWKECAANPVYPQGGTWIYDRAGWCPGMATDLQESMIDQYTTPGQTHNFDYDVDIASGDSRYIVSHQLVNYGAPNHSLDVRILDIMNPSNKIEYARENPICYSPKVIIQNVGSTPLTSVKIDYGLNDKGFVTQQWNGNLAFMEKDTVTLNVQSWFWQGLNGPTGNQFHARVKDPNSGTDEYALNDKMYSSFEITNVMPRDFIMVYKGNTAFAETKIEFIDESGTTVFTKVATNTAVNFDTIKLNPGCYSMLISDNDDDGISFWANSDGNGVLLLRDFSNTPLYTLEGDFGKYTRYNFTVDYPLSYEELTGTLNTKIYPNPTTDELFISAEGIEKATIEVYNALGKKLNISMSKNSNEVKLNTTTLANGFYFVKVVLGKKRSTKKFLISK